MNANKEVYIADYPTPFSIHETEIIIKQMKNSICKISNGKKKGTGFFCEFSSPGEKSNKALITCYHVFDDLQLDKKKEMTLSIYNKDYSIDLRKKRKCYFNKNYDITIIELFSNEIKGIEYLELDDSITKKKFFKEPHIGETLYNIQYPKGGEVFVSYGIFREEKLKENFNFAHSCSTDEGSSGSPILSKNTKKIIGIHIGTPECQLKKKQYNIATILFEPIKGFISKFNKGKENNKEFLPYIKEPLYNNLDNNKNNKRYQSDKVQNDFKLGEEVLKSNNIIISNIRDTINKNNNIDDLMKKKFPDLVNNKKVKFKIKEGIKNNCDENNNINFPFIDNKLKKNKSSSNLKNNKHS